MPQIYRELVNARKTARMTQSELGHTLDMPQGYISQVENGKHDIKLSTLQDWARILGFEVMLIPKAEVQSVSYILKAEPLSQLPRAYVPLPETLE